VAKPYEAAVARAIPVKVANNAERGFVGTAASFRRVDGYFRAGRFGDREGRPAGATPM
jgi:hypothetical protein